MQNCAGKFRCAFNEIDSIWWQSLPRMAEFANGFDLYRCRSGEVNMKRRASPRLAENLEKSAVVADDASNGCQPQAGSFSRSFRAKKWLKQPVKHLG